MATARIENRKLARDVMTPRRSWPEQLLRWCARPPLWTKIIAWCVIVGALIGVRLHLMHVVPFYLWSKDGGSYADSAWQWLDSGVWESDPRRGPTYSLLIAFCLKMWGTFWSLVVVQHLIGGFCVFAAILLLWRLHGASAWLPVTACGVAYAVYAGPIATEHLVRNESLIFLFATMTLTGWFAALRRDSIIWLGFSGLAFGLLFITKNVFAPFFIIVLIALGWSDRHQLLRAAARIAVFVVSCAVPIVGNRILTQLTVHEKPLEPQAGLLLYARVAQFTVLDGGIEPALKALIRDDILAYRRRPKLDNNIILNRTAVPHMREYLFAHGATPSDLNRVCRALALEAIRAHPGEYARQFWRDFQRLHLSYGERLQRPDLGEFRFTSTWLGAMTNPHPTLRRDETVAAIAARASRETFRMYARMVNAAWLFNYSPVLLTSLLLPVLTILATGTLRWWWLGLCAVWAFNILLLSTIGKPMDRYLVPVMPVMFWTLGSATADLWQMMTTLFARYFGTPHAAEPI